MTANICLRTVAMLAILLSNIALGQTTSVSVTGVVVNREETVNREKAVAGTERDSPPDESKNRLGSVHVELVVDKAKGGRLTDDSTSLEGLYNLSCDSVNESVNGLWVICVDERYVARPVPAELESPKQGIRRAKNQDMLADYGSKKPLNPQDAAWQIIAITETACVKQRLKLIDQEEFDEEVTEGTWDVLARMPPLRDWPMSVFELVRKEIRDELLPEPVSQFQFVRGPKVPEWAIGVLSPEELRERLRKTTG